MVKFSDNDGFHRVDSVSGITSRVSGSTGRSAAKFINLHSSVTSYGVGRLRTL